MLFNLDNGPKKKNFHHDIHDYTLMFAFTSMGANIDHLVNVQASSYIKTSRYDTLQRETFCSDNN